MNEPMRILPHNWRKMSELQKVGFINYGKTLADRDKELAKRGYKW